MINAEPIISKMKNQKINYDKVLKKLIVVVHLVVHIR